MTSPRTPYHSMSLRLILLCFVYLISLNTASAGICDISGSSGIGGTGFPLQNGSGIGGTGQSAQLNTGSNGMGGTGAAVAKNSGIGGTGAAIAKNKGIGGTGKPIEINGEGSGIGGTGAAIANNKGIGGTGKPIKIDTNDRGIGGTGTAVAAKQAGFINGTITGFGSICVNGIEVHYTDSTPIQVDGQQTDKPLAIGQVVSVNVSGTGNEVTATQIDVLHAAKGPVSSIDFVKGEMIVMGQTIQIPSVDNSQINSLSNIGTGDFVAISGIRTPQGKIVASRVDQVAPQTMVSLNGPVSDIANNSFNIQGMKISSPQSHSLAIGQQVQVSGHITNGALQANSIAQAQLQQPNIAVGGLISIEGFIQKTDNQAVIELQGKTVVIPPALREQMSHVAETEKVIVTGLLEKENVIELDHVLIPPAFVATEMDVKHELNKPEGRERRDIEVKSHEQQNAGSKEFEHESEKLPEIKSNERERHHEHEVETPEIPKHDNSDSHEIEIPEVSEHDKPEVDDLETPEVHEHDAPEPHEIEVPEVHEHDAPEPHEIEVPEVHEHETPEIPDIEDHESHEYEAPELPEIETPETPEIEAPEMPEYEAPEVPEVEVPEMPEYEAPEVPEVEVPEMPEYEAPEVPEVEVPEMPEYEAPEIPEIEEHESHEYEAPEIPEIEDHDDH